jgi:hypothetical protein
MRLSVARRLRWLAPATLFTLAACSSSDSDEIREGWRATQRVLDESVERVQIQPRDGDLDPDGNESFDVSLRVDCPSGGSAQLDAVHDGEGAIDLSLAFAGCKSEGIVIDGGISLSMTWADSENGFEMALRYEGELVWSGAVSMTCEIDLSVEVSGSFDPDTFVGSNDVEIEGHVCGEPADALLVEEDFG